MYWKAIFWAFVLTGIIGCKKQTPLFRLVENTKSGLSFENRITVNDSMNILDNEFIYNGAGVAVGDLNGDSLQDIYFCGNQVDNKLYLNKGDLHFDEITGQAGVQKKKGQWSSGVTFVDINADGKLDIYVCNTMINTPSMLRDLLFINQGNDAMGIPHFKEMGEAFGIRDDVQNSISTFFDYDLDGDLDLFVAVNFIDVQYPNQFVTRIPDGKSPTRDLLLRNDFDSALGHAVFHDVSLQAGIVWGGYSHSCLIHDFNEDGWPDIYVANDYLSNDLLYLNNRNGTFSNKIGEIFKHQSYSSMGSDVADINNDGHADLFTAEMLPNDNKRKKVNMNANNYNHYLFTDQYKYEYQYVRNTLQLYQGTHPQTKLPLYSDIAFLAGVEATDWSWSPLLADFDNDGYRDLLVTNGFPKDIIDHDFGAFRKSINSSMITKTELLQMIPEVKVPKYIFKNNGDLTFTDKSREWGLAIPGFTNGTAYGDLDNDGDLDIVTNNINDPSWLFENTLITTKQPQKKDTGSNYLRVSLHGPADNRMGLGAVVKIWVKGQVRVAESTCVRGYLSHSEDLLHFGLGQGISVDSMEVRWSDGRTQQIKAVSANQTLTLRHDLASVPLPSVPVLTKPLLEEFPAAYFGVDYVHEENDFIDFNIQKTLPHKLSQYGPALAVGDVNGDGLDDMIVGSSSRFQGPTLLTQTGNGKFSRKVLPLKNSPQMKEEDMGLLLFDADADGDNDLYVVRGSGQHEARSPLYQDILCENDGKGNFNVVTQALPLEQACGQNVKAADIDGDGDLDLFVGGRVEPKSYPKAGESLLLRNDSRPGQIRFTNVTAQWLPREGRLGMVSDALWTDFDKDGKPDLLIAGEWMPLTFLKNTGKQLQALTIAGKMGEASGWWNSLATADLDQDGDMDYVAGNFGLNQYFRCSTGEPLRIYAKDFDNNGSYDAFISCYFPDSSGKRHEYFFHTKDDMQKQLILIRKKFERYADFGRATVKDVFTKEEMKDVQELEAHDMRSAWIENLGQGKFQLHILPTEAQMAPIYGIQCEDVNGDGLADILLTGNDHGMETGQGKADAFNGLVLLNTGKGNFRPAGFNSSGFFVPGDARALAKIGIGNSTWLVATQNRRGLSFFRLPTATTVVDLDKTATKAIITYENNRTECVEFSWGSSFLAQSTRKWQLPQQFRSILFLNSRGETIRAIKKH